MNKILSTLVLALLFPALASAVVRLPAFISDGMVLQRERPLVISGWADANEEVTVRFTNVKGKSLVPRATAGAKLQSSYVVRADASGSWSVSLPPLAFGGPFRLIVNNVEVNDVLVCDVFLCSGQSNMELPVSRVREMFKGEVAAYENKDIRQLVVPKEVDFHGPRDDLSSAKWQPLNRHTVDQFSALAYFFAKEVYVATKVPIGIVNASWGGTLIESWIPEPYLKPFPRALAEKQIYEDDAYCKQIKQLEGVAFHRWNTALISSDPGVKGRWQSPDYDDSDWRLLDPIAEQDKWATDGVNPIAGSHWFRKSVEVSSDDAAKDATLRVGTLVDADSVYVNGVFVGATGYRYPPRIYRIPAGLLHEGRNVITVRLVSNAGKAEFIKDKPYKLIFGLREQPIEGQWRYHLGAPMPPAPDMMFFCYKPTCLYNAMIAPLHSMTFRGVVWYQGESNVRRYNEYAALLAQLMAAWRECFADASMPFYIVELANYLSPAERDERAKYAGLRLQQAAAAEADEHAVLIRNADLGEWNDIHPLDKKTIGIRVAREVIADIKKK